MNNILAIVLSSNALTVILTAVITAINNRRSRLKVVEEMQQKMLENQKIAEKDALRTQLLLMIADYPNEKTDILRLAEHYFKDLEGNWVASNIFNHWVTEKCDGINPEWLSRD